MTESVDSSHYSQVTPARGSSRFPAADTGETGRVDPMASGQGGSRQLSKKLAGRDSNAFHLDSADDLAQARASSTVTQASEEVKYVLPLIPAFRWNKLPGSFFWLGNQAETLVSKPDREIGQHILLLRLELPRSVLGQHPAHFVEALESSPPLPILP